MQLMQGIFKFLILTSSNIAMKLITYKSMKFVIIQKINKDQDKIHYSLPKAILF